MSKFYNVSEVAYLYGVTEDTVRIWIREGLLKAKWVPVPNSLKCVGAGYVISEQTLNEFDPIKSKHSLTLHLQSKRKRDIQNYMDYLDEQADKLYREIEFIEGMRKHFRDIEPYL